MSETQFFQTRMGSNFFEGTLPRLIRTLERVATALEKANPGKEQLEPTLVYWDRNLDKLCTFGAATKAEIVAFREEHNITDEESIILYNVDFSIVGD